MTHRLHEILAKLNATKQPLPTIGNIEGTILEAHRVGRINLAYRAAQDLENMEYEIKTQAAELLKLRKIAAAAEKMAERFEGSYNKGDEEVLAEYNEAISE